jgi:hypothetical protein
VCGLGINQIGLLRVDAEGMSSIYCKEQVKHLRTLIGWCWSTIRSTCANAQSNCSPVWVKRYARRETNLELHSWCTVREASDLRGLETSRY